MRLFALYYQSYGIVKLKYLDTLVLKDTVILQDLRSQVVFVLLA